MASPFGSTDITDNATLTAAQIRMSSFQVPGDFASLTSVQFYLAGSAGQYAKAVIAAYSPQLTAVDPANATILANGISGASEVNGTGWVTFTWGTAPTLVPGMWYWFGVIPSADLTFYYKFNYGTNRFLLDASNDYTTPTNPTDGSLNDHLMACQVAYSADSTNTVIRESSIGTAATGTAVTVAAPTGTTTGDLVVVVVHANGQTTIVDNNGATPFTEDLNDFQQSTGGGTVSVFSRRIQAGDPTTYAFTIGATGRWTAVAVTFQKPHDSAIYDVAPAVGNSTASSVGGTSANSVDITTNYTNAIHAAVCCPDGSLEACTGVPSGYVVNKNAGDQNIAVCTKRIASATATGEQAFAWTNSNGWITLSFAIRNYAVDEGPTSITSLLESLRQNIAEAFVTAVSVRTEETG